MLASATAIFSFITLSVIFAKIPEFPSLQTLVKTKVDHYFDNINQIYAKKGFWWRIAPEQLYVEMVIEDRLPEDIRRNLSEGGNFTPVNEMINSNKPEEEKSAAPKSANPFKNDDETKRNTNRSKANKNSAKVAPINTSTAKVKSYNQLSNDFNANMTLQSQPMKLRNKLNQDKDDLTRNETGYDTYNYAKGQRKRVIRSDDSRSETGLAPTGGRRQGNTKSHFDYNSKSNNENAVYGFQQDVSQDNESEMENPPQQISPEQRLGNKAPERYESPTHQNASRGHRKEDSMKMEDILGEFEQDFAQKSSRAKNTSTVNYGNKNQQFMFGEQENSNFGTEWNSDRDQK